MAFLLFFFGNAVNVVHFCCDVCRVHGTEVFTESICHEQPENSSLAVTKDFDPESHDGYTCSLDQKDGYPFHLTHQHEACSLSRVSITLDHLYKSIKIKSLVLTSFLFSVPIFSDLGVHTTPSPIFPLYSSGVSLAGRLLLHKICVLRN